MSDKRKKRARALAAKTGMSYQAAINALAAGATPKQEKEARTLEQLLAEIPAPTTFSVYVARAPAVAGSADPQVAAQRSRELAEDPQYYAESGGRQLSITRAEMDLLLAAGAAGGDVQIIRAFKHQSQLTFSGQCSKCDRYIWCGSAERE